MKICKIDHDLEKQLRSHVAAPIRKLVMKAPPGSVNIVDCDAVTDGQDVYTVWELETKDGVPEADGMRIVLCTAGGLPPHTISVLGK